LHFCVAQQEPELDRVIERPMCGLDFPVFLELRDMFLAVAICRTGN
jgi:hypothetical protein